MSIAKKFNVPVEEQLAALWTRWWSLKYEHIDENMMLAKGSAWTSLAALSARNDRFKNIDEELVINHEGRN